MDTEELVRGDAKALSSHPFATGETVTVFCIRVFRRPVIEGRAIIVAPVTGEPDLYQICFEGDWRIRERFAYPELQRDPERMLAIMIEQWRDGMTPEVLEEFFPEDLL